MAQNNTYITKVYHEHEGDRYVAVRDGVFAIESGGSVLVYSGAQMTIESGANLDLAGGALAAADFRKLVVSELGGAVVTIVSGAVTRLEVSNLPRNARIVNIVANDTMTAGSFYLTSVSAGREVFLRLVGDVIGGWTADKTSIVLYQSGCILLGSVGNAVASFHLQTSATHDTAVYLKAVADNTWAIIAELGSTSES